MKVSRIEIKDFQQFKDFQVDLTYPKGHEKAGEPLDKVCFIGRSGTGKTTLLNVLKEMLTAQYISAVHNLSPDLIAHKEIFQIEFNSAKLIKQRSESIGDGYFGNPDYISTVDKRDLKLIYFPAEYIERHTQIESIEKKLLTEEELRKQVEVRRNRLKSKKVFDFQQDNSTEIWDVIFLDIQDYYFNRAKYAENLLESDNEQGLINQFNQWKKENENPLNDFANKLNPLIKEFNLKVNENPKFNFYDELRAVSLTTLNGQDIPRAGWSSGTKQLINTAIPLFKIDTKDTIVLFDEPERSLYPDLQRRIIPYYVEDLAPEAQFFYATHSPVILSSFEPWEIVVLDFDNQGFVQPKKMYKGDRHIDNYVANPRYLRWDDILTTYLGLEEEGSEERIKMRHELAILGNKLKHLNGGNEALKQELWKEYSEKATKLGWSTIHEK